MIDDVRQVAGLDALTLELDRWSAYASGALDDARVRHRHVREHVRRAERSLALAEATVELDGAALDDVSGQLDRLAEEFGLLTLELGQRTTLNLQLIETAREIRISVEASVRENLRRQERAASAVSTAARDEQRARAVLHRALDGQRIAFKRRWRSSTREPAARQLAIAETEARRTHEVHASAKHELATLRNDHECLLLELAGLDTEIAEAESVTGRLEAAAHALHEGRQALADARSARSQAEAAHRLAAAHVGTMRVGADRAVGGLERAASWERDATGTYEDVQQLTADVALSLRDRLDAAGAAQRARHATSAGTATPR